MDKFDHENIIDTDFEEVKEELLKDKNITKEPLYYTRVQVASILKEKESTISYWSKEFQPILKLKIINMTRKYTKKDVENLLFIQKLIRQDKMTIKQVLEYCSEKGFSLEDKTIESDNPLAIQTFTSAVTLEVQKQLSEMQNQIILQQQEMIQGLQKVICENNELMKRELSLTVDESINEKFNDLTKDINNKLELQSQQNQDNFNNMNNKNIDRDIKLVDDLLKRMERRKEDKQNAEAEEPKGFFSKIFHFKN